MNRHREVLAYIQGCQRCTKLNRRSLWLILAALCQHILLVGEMREERATAD